MREIPVTNTRPAIVNDSDYELVARHKWHRSSKGYAQTVLPLGRGQQRTVLMHRLILDAPKGIQVDHIDHDKLNNRRSNIRLCSGHDNQGNRRSSVGSSRFKGVTWSKQKRKWKAYIQQRKSTCYLGYYDAEEAAARAYDAAAREYFGEFAYLNFPQH